MNPKQLAKKICEDMRDFPHNWEPHSTESVIRKGTDVIVGKDYRSKDVLIRQKLESDFLRHDWAPTKITGRWAKKVMDAVYAASTHHAHGKLFNPKPNTES